MVNNITFNKKLWVKIISILTICIYLIFLYIDAITKDLGNVYSIYLKYSIIILCFIITLLIGNQGYSNKDKFLLQLARFFTLIADYFLLVKDIFVAGILFFCLVQITYIVRHSLMEHKSYRNFIFLLLALGISLLIPFKLKDEFIERELLVLALAYTAILITSVYSALSTLTRGIYSKSSAIFIAFGMMLFFFCDLSVGIYNIIGRTSLNHMISSRIKFLIGFFIWVFYAPSQILLSWSGFKNLYTKNDF